ncbi:MAG: hypothetical protein KDB88_07050 [Flavobacteriales bacterium]|nr:hypothetical protein [Flavobacteriales bacterium]
MLDEKRLWGANAAWWMGWISISFALAGPLLVPGLIMGVLAISLGRWGVHRAVRRPMVYAQRSIERARVAAWTGGVGTILALVFWFLYAYRFLA